MVVKYMTSSSLNPHIWIFLQETRPWQQCKDLRPLVSLVNVVAGCGHLTVLSSEALTMRCIWGSHRQQRRLLVWPDSTSGSANKQSHTWQLAELTSFPLIGHTFTAVLQESPDRTQRLLTQSTVLKHWRERLSAYTGWHREQWNIYTLEFTQIIRSTVVVALFVQIPRLSSSVNMSSIFAAILLILNIFCVSIHDMFTSDDSCNFCNYAHLPSVLWRCWSGGRKGIRPVKTKWWVLAWLSVWREVQTCIWPSWCHCHSLSLASVKSRLVLPFWYRLTRKKGR